jgi:hypothetical protein
MKRLPAILVPALGSAGMLVSAYLIYAFWAINSLFFWWGPAWSSLGLCIALLICSAILTATGFRRLRSHA